MPEEIQSVQTMQIYTPPSLMALAIQNNVDIERLTKLMELQERWQANEAKKDFVAAMSAFKKNPPQIIKDMHVEYKAGNATVKYNHASLGNITASVSEALSEHGLSTRWETKQENNQITVTCFITHISGHSESTSLTASPDNSGGKNAIQAIGSAVTYLQRYTLLTITGLATNEFENDGRGAEKQSEPTKGTTTIVTKEDQARMVFLKNCSYARKELATITGNDNAYLHIIGDKGFTSAEEIPANLYNEIRDALKAKMNELKVGKNE
jgi:hypothetical protein